MHSVPYLNDFQKQGTLDPLVLVNKFEHYQEFLVKIKESDCLLTVNEGKLLKVFGREWLPGMRQQELFVIQEILQGESVFTRESLRNLFLNNGLNADEETVDSVVGTLDLSFYVGSQKINYAGGEFLEVKDGQIQISEPLKIALKNPYFVHLLDDCLSVSLEKAKGYEPHQPFTLYNKYRRRDPIRLLNWKMGNGFMWMANIKFSF